MAQTTQGAQLTDAHRRRQLIIATASDSEFRRAWRLLDPSDIDGTRGRFERQMAALIARQYKVSQANAIAYLANYRLAEIGTGSGPVVATGLSFGDTLDLMSAKGPSALKERIGKGMDLSTALATTQRQVAAEARKAILSAGRGVVRDSGRADRRAIGWRRKSDGDPCTFCATLVSRGPAYTSAARALSKGNGDPYHTHCACTVEVIYGDWIPTEQEQQWVDEYRTAAQQAEEEDGVRTEQTVLWRMRANGNFRDSPARRAADL